jgi:hypothetical protein
LLKTSGAGAHERRIHGVCSEWKQHYRQHDRIEGEHLAASASGHVVCDRHGSSGKVTFDRNVTWLGRRRNAAQAMSMLAEDDAVTSPALPKSPTDTTRVADRTG